MLKLVFTGIWVCAVTLGAVYFSIKMAAGPAPVDEEALKRAGEEIIAGELVTIPVLGNGAVQGYFIAKLSFAAEKTKLKDIKLPVKEVVTDELYTLLIGNNVVDIRDAKTFDLGVFKTTVRDALNKRLEDDVIKTVLIEQLEYVDKPAAAEGDDPAKLPRMVPVPIVDKNGETAQDKLPVSKPAEGATH